jgi:MFS family permease
MAMAAWFVPLSTLLDAHGLAAIRPYAFASTATAALVTPLVFGAIADRHAPPIQVLRWLMAASALCLVAIVLAIDHQLSPTWILGLIQIFALVSTPTWSLSNTIVLSRLTNARREFGPIRAAGTAGWMVGCWLISGLGADASTSAGWAAAALCVILAGFTWFMPSVQPIPSPGPVSFRQRLGLDALSLLSHKDHRAVFLTAALVAIPLSAFYPYTPPHLRDLGFEHTSAWMSLGQVTEFAAMFALAALLGRCRLKWIFAAGLTFAFLRYSLYAINQPAWMLAGVSLHGLAFTLFFITAPIYLNERIPPAWRARAQALLSLMTMGVGNLLGYLGIGAWFHACQQPDGVAWSQFWIGLALSVAVITAYFLATYHGRPGHAPSAPSPPATRLP